MAFRALVAGLIFLIALLSPAGAVVPELGQPSWAELSLEQKQILAPLSRDWDKLDAVRKKKWLGIAKRYPSMKPEEQARMQRRMQDWAALTPDQRSQVRSQYKNLKIAPPETKQAIREKWERYKELPEAEKKRLAEKAAKRSGKSGTAKPLGLAPKPKSVATSIQLDPPPPAAALVTPPEIPAAAPPLPPQDEAAAPADEAPVQPPPTAATPTDSESPPSAQ